MGPSGNPSHYTYPDQLRDLTSNLQKSSSLNLAHAEPEPVAVLSNIVLKDWETPLPGTHRLMDELLTSADGMLNCADITAAVKGSHGYEKPLLLRYYSPEWMAWARLPVTKVRPARKDSGELWLEIRAQVQEVLTVPQPSSTADVAITSAGPSDVPPPQHTKAPANDVLPPQHVQAAASKASPHQQVNGIMGVSDPHLSISVPPVPQASSLTHAPPTFETKSTPVAVADDPVPAVQVWQAPSSVVVRGEDALDLSLSYYRTSYTPEGTSPQPDSPEAFEAYEAPPDLPSPEIFRAAGPPMDAPKPGRLLLSEIVDQGGTPLSGSDASLSPPGVSWKGESVPDATSPAKAELVQNREETFSPRPPRPEQGNKIPVLAPVLPYAVPHLTNSLSSTHLETPCAEFADFAGMENDGGIEQPWICVEWDSGTLVSPNDRKTERTIQGKAAFLENYGRLYPKAIDWLENRLEQPTNGKLFGVERSVMVTPDKLASRLPGLLGYLAPENGIDRFVLFVAANRDSFSSKGATRVNGRWKAKTTEWCTCPETPDLVYLDHKWADEPGLDWNANWICFVHVVAIDEQRKDPNCNCLAAIRFVRARRRSPGGGKVQALESPGAGEGSQLVGYRSLSMTFRGSQLKSKKKPSDMQTEATQESNGVSDETDSVARSGSEEADTLFGGNKGTPLGSKMSSSSAANNEATPGNEVLLEVTCSTSHTELKVPRLADGQVDWKHPDTQVLVMEVPVFLVEAQRAMNPGSGSSTPDLLAVVDRLRLLTHLLEEGAAVSKQLEVLAIKLHETLVRGLQALHREFYRLLESNRGVDDKPIDLRADLELQVNAIQAGGPDAPKTFTIPEMPDVESIRMLHALVTRLVMPDWKPENGISFKDRRREALTRNLKRLGVVDVTSEQVELMEKKELETRIKAWEEQLRAAVRILFTAERQLCNEVLAGLDPYKDRCFCEVTSGGLIWLFTIGQTLTVGRKAPEKLCKFLDMYRTVVALNPVVAVLFNGPAGAKVRQSMKKLVEKLDAAVRETVDTFEMFVKSEAAAEELESKARQRRNERQNTIYSMDFDNARNEVGVQKVPSYVLNYVCYLASSQNHFVATLGKIYGESSTSDDDATSFLTAGGVAGLFLRLMHALDQSLLSKAKSQRDVYLQEVYLLNHISYIIAKISACDARAMLGDKWIVRHEEELQRRRKFYVDLLLGTMEEQVFNPQPTDAKGAINRLKIFNSEFDLLRLNKSHQMLTDSTLQTSICTEILRRVQSGYRKFCDNHSQLLSTSKSLGKLFVHQPEDVSMKLRSSFISSA